MCRMALAESSIMFPHHEKDYASDGIIARDWAFVAKRLKAAFHLTIFGYSGPATDYKAKELLLDGWKRTPMRDFSHVEIVDVGDGDGLRRNWRAFIPFHHDMVVRSFWESTIARWPRRTAEYKTAASLYGAVSERIGPMRTGSLRELQAWHAEMAEAERELGERALSQGKKEDSTGACCARTMRCREPGVPRTGNRVFEEKARHTCRVSRRR